MQCGPGAGDVKGKELLVAVAAKGGACLAVLLGAQASLP